MPGDYAMIEVSDTGVGMPPEVATRIFDPFFTTKPRGEGTVLGLSMVFGFMKQSGGHINVYSEERVGTTFRLYLPRDHRASVADKAAPTPDVPRSAGEIVLVVEDNPALRRLVVQQLGALGIRDAGKPKGAATALSTLQSGDSAFALVFADIVMAGQLDGYDLAVIVRETLAVDQSRADLGLPRREPWPRHRIAHRRATPHQALPPRRTRPHVARRAPTAASSDARFFTSPRVRGESLPPTRSGVDRAKRGRVRGPSTRV